MDRISKGITEKVSRSGEFASAFFKWAYTYKRTWLRRGYDTPVLNKIVSILRYIVACLLVTTTFHVHHE